MSLLWRFIHFVNSFPFSFFLTLSCSLSLSLPPSFPPSLPSLPHAHTHHTHTHTYTQTIHSSMAGRLPTRVRKGVPISQWESTERSRKPSSGRAAKTGRGRPSQCSAVVWSWGIHVYAYMYVYIRTCILYNWLFTCIWAWYLYNYAS